MNSDEKKGEFNIDSSQTANQDEKALKKANAVKKARAAKKENAVYAAEERVILVLDILKRYTDENHFLSQTELLKIMFENDSYSSDTKLASQSSRNTLHKTIKRMLEQMNPVLYDDNDQKYRIKYDGYDREEPPKSIKNLRYVHDFSNEELDQLMHAVNFDSSLSLADKQNLMGKLQATASDYYKSPYYNKDMDKVKFYDYGIYTRLDTYPKRYGELARNIKVIQSAINDNVKIQFTFNRYNRNHELEARSIRTADGKYTVSPYYIVVYQEFYYLLGAFDNPDKPGIYRIDLMTEVEMAVDEKGKRIDIWPLRKVPGLPDRDKWNPELFMREHLYMFYDEPRNVTLRIQSGDYTFLHDWFGDTYSVRRKPSDKEGYDLVDVRCTTNAMVHFALQWCDRVEVMDEDIREKIREEVKKMMKEKYGDV